MQSGDQARDPRLDEALAALAEFAASDDDDVPAFLAKHAHLHDLLAPMVFVQAAETSDAAEPDTGTLLGKFRLWRVLGRGGMGTVYAADDTVLHRQVALKVLAPTLLLDRRAHGRFKREAELMGSLGNPHIAKVFEVGEANGQPYLAMELIDGVSLADLLRAIAGKPAARQARDLTTALTRLQAERWAPNDVATERATVDSAPTLPDDYIRIVVGWATEVAHALACAHRAGVVHRDVKPNNILIARDGSAVLTDFGLARHQGEVGLTFTGEFAGTLNYSSPEQFGAAAELDGRADVFALGVTLYELLTHRRPFDADNDVDVRARIQRHEPPPATALNPKVPRDLAAVVERAMEKDRERRYPDAGAMATDLQRWRDGFAVEARPVSSLTRARRWVARNRFVSAFLATLLVSTITVTVLAWHALASAATANDLFVQSLGDRTSGQLKGIRNKAATLFPTDPALADELADLIAQADVLRVQLPKLERQRNELRRRGRQDPQDDADAAADRTTHPMRAQLDYVALALAQLEQRWRGPARNALPPESRNAVETLRTDLGQRQARLEALLGDYRHHRFDQQEDRSRHDRLEDAILDLVAFAHDDDDDEISDLRRRLDATHAMAQSLQDHERAWQDAAAAVGADPRFAGLRLTPQAGLVPLGPDPLSGLHEFSHLESGDPPPPRPENGSVVIEPSTGIVFVLLPGGKASLGDGVDVDLDPFFCSKFEVSVGQMRRLTRGLQPDVFGRPRWSIEPEVHPCGPARQLSWNLAAELLPRFGLALPTGAQWEHACRAGATTAWYTGDDPAALRGVANFCWAKPPCGSLWLVDAPTTPNDFGLCHLHGNVAEWLDDYRSGVISDTRTGQRRTSGYYRWFAGGFFSEGPGELSQCGHFDSINSGLGAETVGIRPVRMLRL